MLPAISGCPEGGMQLRSASFVNAKTPLRNEEMNKTGTADVETFLDFLIMSGVGTNLVGCGDVKSWRGIIPTFPAVN